MDTITGQQRIFISPLDVQTCVSLANDVKQRSRRKRSSTELPQGTMKSVTADGFRYDLFGVGNITSLTVSGSFVARRTGTAILLSSYVDPKNRWRAILSEAAICFMALNPLFYAPDFLGRSAGTAAWIAFEIAFFMLAVGLSFFFNGRMEKHVYRRDRPAQLVSRLFNASPVPDLDARSVVSTNHPNSRTGSLLSTSDD